MTLPATYGSFPHLFWDLDPAATVNTRHPVVLRRVLERGTTDDIRRLISPGVALAALDGLGMPEHLRRFWHLVFVRAQAPIG